MPVWLPGVRAAVAYGVPMSSPLRTRGPLPARVYWVRRLLVLGVAVLLVVGLARLLGAGSDASDGGEQAATVASRTTEDQAPAVEEEPRRRKNHQREEQREPRKPRKPAPEGPCSPSDVVVTPKIDEAPGGSDIPVRLQLRTQESEACTWRVSPETLTLKITSGSDLIWTSRQCPADLPTEDVVVRRDFGTSVVFTWDARRSDDECPRHTEWALPGTYHVLAAALGGEPTEVRFELTRPTSETITKTVTPKPDPKDKSGRDGEKSGRDAEKSDRDRTDEPAEESPTEHQAGGDGASEPND